MSYVQNRKRRTFGNVLLLRVNNMKEKKTLTLNSWVIEEIKKRFPKARFNFSGAVEGLLIASMNNPKAYWRSQAKYHKQYFDIAMQKVKLYDSMENEMKKENAHVESREKAIISAIKNKN